MRLVIDGRRLREGRTGVGRYLEALLVEWAATAPPLPEALVVLADRDGLDRIPRGPVMRALVVGEGWPGLAWERWGLGRVLRPDDLLFAPANLVPATWGGRTVLVLHDALLEARPGDFPWHVRLRLRARYRRAARGAGRILVPSEATSRDVQRFYGVPPGRIRAIPPAPGPEFRPLAADSGVVRSARQAVGLGDEPYFLFVGKRSRRRHVPEVLAAFARHGDRRPGDRLVFVGPRGAEGPIGQRGVVDAGHVDEPTLRGLLGGALALLYPSEAEGFGLPVVEAMASGCPVVTLRRDALVEAGGDAPIYLESADVDVLADTLQRLDGGGGVREAAVARGLARASRWTRTDFAEAVRAELAAAARCQRGVAGV